MLISSTAPPQITSFHAFVNRYNAHLLSQTIKDRMGCLYIPSHPTKTRYDRYPQYQDIKTIFLIYDLFLTFEVGHIRWQHLCLCRLGVRAWGARAGCLYLFVVQRCFPSPNPCEQKGAAEGWVFQMLGTTIFLLLTLGTELLKEQILFFSEL